MQSFTADQLVYEESIPYSPGVTLTYERPHPLLQQLESSAKANDLAAVESVLVQLGPFPPDVPGKARGCIAKALLAASTGPPSSEINDNDNSNHDASKRPLIQALFAHGLARRYEFSSLAIDSAIQRADLAMLQTFVDEGGWDVNETGPKKHKRPALRFALRKSEQDDRVRAWLLAHGADPNVEDERHTSALEAAAQWTSVDVLRQLLAHGGNPGREGDESLLFAAERGDLEMVEILVGAGADVNAHEKDGGVGFFVSAPHRRGRSVMVAAVESGSEDVVRFLLRRGARIDLRDARRETPIDAAKRTKNERMVAILGS